jgi:hypothetical protein
MATQVPNRRFLRDAGKTVTKALPAAGASNQSGTIDIGVGPFHPEELDVEISIPAMAAHSDTTKNVTITLQDSADDSSYADVDPAIVETLAGVSSTGTSAKVVVFRLPPGTRRYIQFTQAVTSGGPTLTGSSVTYSLCF